MREPQAQESFRRTNADRFGKVPFQFSSTDLHGFRDSCDAWRAIDALLHVEYRAANQRVAGMQNGREAGLRFVGGHRIVDDHDV